MSWIAQTFISLRWLGRYRQIPLDDADEKALCRQATAARAAATVCHSVGHDDECWSYYRSRAVILHACFLAINLAVSSLLIYYFRKSPSPSVGAASLIHSPAHDVLQFTKHVYNYSEVDSYYIQPPSPEIDDRWHNLILGNFIKLSPEDLRQVGRLDSDPVLLEDGSGVGLINAHHEIHCIMGLYQASHPEYYWPNATAEQKSNQRHHVDHCLDYLLQASMCHGDVGFMTYHWDMNNPMPYWKAAQHSCVNWDGLRDWMAQRKVAIHDPGLLVHPKFGPPYPEGVEEIPTIHDSQTQIDSMT